MTESAKKAKSYVLIKEILNQWLPLDKLVLDRIVNELPNPINAQKFRLPYLLGLNSKDQQPSAEIMKALSICDTREEAPLIIFVAKMLTLSRKQIN